MDYNADAVYLNLVKRVLDEGVESEDRTGVGTISLFGPQVEYDLSKSFPILTTKRIPFKLVTSELLWFLKGDTNIQYLLKNNNHIWSEWPFDEYAKSKQFIADHIRDDFANTFQIQYARLGVNARMKPGNEHFNQLYTQYMKDFEERIVNNDGFANRWGDLGPVYGRQWRNFNGVDQITDLINTIHNNPNSRRMIVSAWNPEKITSMALPPCHTMWQVYVRNGELDLKLYQRSADLFLGVPFNIVSYALLTNILAKEAGLKPGKFIHTFGDAHIYKNHLSQINEQLTRNPVAEIPVLNDFQYKPIDEYEISDFRLLNYHPLPSIKAPVAV